MGVVNIIKLLLAVMNFAKWLTTYINQKDWEATGYAKAFAESVAQLQKNSGIAEKMFNEAKKATDAQLDDELSK